METESKVKLAINVMWVIAAIVALYALLRVFGIIKTSDEKDAKKLAEKKGTWGEEKSTYKKNTTVADNQPNIKSYGDFSDIIWDAKGVVQDHPDAVYGVFRKLKGEAEINAFSRYFQGYKKRDLFGYLQSFLSSEELATIASIIEAKKK